jgi:hypothetical protein
MRLSTEISTRRLFVLTLIAGLTLVGCGSSKTASVVPNPSLTVGLPVPAAAGPVNTYTGAQSPGVWTLTLDNTKDVFSYKPITFPANPAASGSLTVVDGFTRLGESGYALEVEGRAAILRPGDSTAPLVFAVPQTACYSIVGRLRFQYIGMQTGPDGAVGSAGPTLGYGSIVASTDSTGKSWDFQDLQGNIVSGPGSLTGVCTTTGSNAAIALSGPTVLNDLWPPNESIQTAVTSSTQSNIWIGPSGFFVADQSDSTTSPASGASVAGVAEPSSPLMTSDVASHQYLGFLYESPSTPYGGVSPSAAVTSPVAFGQVASSETMMTGGIFPNDDVRQTPNSDIVLDLGKQDASFNGLYTSVSITVLDPAQNCANYTGSGEKATSGINTQGYFTCTFAGSAVAGNPEGKYAIFLTSYNWAAQLGGAPMQMYLFQQ